MYKVVEFLDKNETAIVATAWLDGTSCCMWPHYKTDKRNFKAAEDLEKANDTWHSYPIKELSTTGE